MFLTITPKILYDEDDTLSRVSRDSAGIDRMLGLVSSGQLDPAKKSSQEAIQDVEDTKDEKDTLLKGKNKKEVKKKTSDSVNNEDSEPIEDENEPEQQSETDVLKEQIKALQAQLNIAISNKDLEPEAPAAKPEPVATVTPAPPSAEPPPQDPISFIDEADYDGHEFIADAANLNKAFNTVMQKTLETATLNMIKMVHNLVPKYTHLAIESEKFFAQNPEIAEVREYAGNVFQEITNKEPKLSISERFAKTREMVYERLKLPGQRTGNDVTNQQPTPVKKEVKSKFPKGSAAREGNEGVDTLRGVDPKKKEQIDRMLKVAAY